MQFKKLLITSVCGLLFAQSVFADNNFEPLLNKVTLDFSAEKWVTSKEALVTIGINLSLNDRDMSLVQSGILEKLNKIADKTEWHIIQFNSSLDQSGLEKIQGQATARLPESVFSELRERAKKLSHPGETFTIDDIQFTPSDTEIRDATSELRNMIYQQIKTEINQLNQTYPEQKYTVHDIRFFNAPGPLSMGVFMNQAKIARPSLPIGDQLKLTATVVLSAAPDQAVVNLVHGK